MSFRILLSAALVAASVVAGSSAIAAPKAAGKPAAKTVVAFGLTQALATLQTCQNGRFEGDSMMALGGVLQENQPRINAAPVDKRMELMNKIVAEETAKATAWHKANKLDCATAPERAAGYWNRIIQAMAIAQQAELLEKQKKAPVGAAKPAVVVKPASAAGAAVSLP